MENNNKKQKVNPYRVLLFVSFIVGIITLITPLIMGRTDMPNPYDFGFGFLFVMGPGVLFAVYYEIWKN